MLARDERPDAPLGRRRTEAGNGFMTDEAGSSAALASTVSLPPRRSLGSDVRRELRELRRYHELLRRMVSTELRTTYIGTFFGFVWWLLDPVLLMFAYLLFIGVILHRRGPDFPLYVFTSVVVWKFFSSSVRVAIGTTLGKITMMRQIAFPRSILPLAATVSEAIRFLFGLVVVLALAAAYGDYPAPTLLALAPVTLVVFVLALGLGYFFAALNVYFRDVSALTQHLFQIWFYLSPGLYTVVFIPESWRQVYKLNPFATLLPAYHRIVMDRRLPDFVALGWVGMVSLAVLAAGFLFFVRLQSSFPKFQ
jgi:lipopolysaccharide transport system permease protein